MDNPPQNELHAAAQMLSQGNNDNAIEILEPLLASDNEPHEVTRMLAEAHRGRGDLETARRYCEQSVAIDPEYHRAHFLLGVICANAGDLEMSMSALERAIEVRPDYFDAVRALAAVAAQSGRRDRALPCYRQLVASGIVGNDILLEYAETAEHEGALDEAIMAREELLHRDPGNAENRFNLASLVGKNAPSVTPPQMVAQTFDEYAPRFESHLANLGYRGPDLLFDALSECGVIDDQTGDGLNVLDIGCGTGLCAPRFRKIAKRLVGVDLSEKMLDQARNKSLYDELHCRDLIDQLSLEAQYDLIIAADTLIYLGDLMPLFTLSSQRVVPGGCFAMTIERGDQQDFVVSRSHRYQHSADYVHRVAEETGWKIRLWTDCVIRQEHRQDMAGFVVVLQRD